MLARMGTSVPIEQDLPGADLVTRGLADLAADRRSAEALLVAQAATRLRAAGIPVPDRRPAEPEAALYRLLEARDPDGAYVTYNALRARLVSFCDAVEHDAARRQR
jgi:hypothetical protein